MYTDLALYIDGKWVGGNGRKGEEVLNPATEKPLAHLPHASKADLDEALAAAKTVRNRDRLSAFGLFFFPTSGWRHERQPIFLSG